MHICAVFLSGIRFGCSGDPQGSLGSALRWGGRSPALSWHRGSFGSCHTEGCCQADALWEGFLFLFAVKHSAPFPFQVKALQGLVSSSFPRSAHLLPESTHLLPRSAHLLPGYAHLWSAAFTELLWGA